MSQFDPSEDDRALQRNLMSSFLQISAVAILIALCVTIMGLPAAGLLTLLVLVTAIVQIPAVLIMVPLIAWVYSFADPLPATVFAIYSVVVALSDNVLKPLLLGRGVDLPVLVVLLGAIGGMVAFGVIGLFLGAVLLGVGYELLMDWIRATGTADGQASSR